MNIGINHELEAVKIEHQEFLTQIDGEKISERLKAVVLMLILDEGQNILQYQEEQALIAPPSKAPTLENMKWSQVGKTTYINLVIIKGNEKIVEEISVQRHHITIKEVITGTTPTGEKINLTVKESIYKNWLNDGYLLNNGYTESAQINMSIKGQVGDQLINENQQITMDDTYPAIILQDGTTGCSNRIKNTHVQIQTEGEVDTLRTNGEIISKDTNKEDANLYNNGNYGSTLTGKVNETETHEDLLQGKLNLSKKLNFTHNFLKKFDASDGHLGLKQLMDCFSKDNPLTGFFETLGLPSRAIPLDVGEELFKNIASPVVWGMGALCDGFSTVPSKIEDALNSNSNSAKEPNEPIASESKILDQTICLSPFFNTILQEMILQQLEAIEENMREETILEENLAPLNIYEQYSLAI